jgi:tetratricopeptide (TPR) repeat protein
MKKLFIVLMILSSTLCNAQKEKRVIGYNYLNEGDYCLHQKEFRKALANYYQGFSILDDCEYNYFINAAIAATNLDIEEEAITFLRKAIKNGVDRDKIKTNDFNKLKVNKDYILLLDSIDFYKKKLIEGYDKDLIKKIDALSIVTKINSSTHGYLEEDIIKILEYEYLFDEILKEGKIPSSKLVGEDKSWVMTRILTVFLKIYNGDNRNKLDEILKLNLYNGSIYPSQYAFCIDHSNKEPFFYMGVELFFEVQILKKWDEINNRRFNHGLKPLESIEIVKTKNSIRIEQKW